MPARVCSTASAPYAHSSDTLMDTGGFNPILLSRCVRCAVKQRCWRISRNAFLQGGKSGATGGQQEGSVTVQTFYGRRVRTLTSELNTRNGGTWGKMGKRNRWQRKITLEQINQIMSLLLQPIRTEMWAGLRWTRAPVSTIWCQRSPRPSEAVGCIFHSRLACRRRPNLCTGKGFIDTGVFRQMFFGGKKQSKMWD